MNNYHKNLSRRIESENENVVLTVKSTATKKQIEIIQEMFPSAEIIKENVNEKQ